MSSDASIQFDEGEEVDLDQWNDFAGRHRLTYDPHVVGHNVYRCPSGAWVRFGPDTQPVRRPGGIDFDACSPPDKADRILIQATWMSEACHDVALLAVAALREFPGAMLSVDPEIAAMITVAPKAEEASDAA